MHLYCYCLRHHVSCSVYILVRFFLLSCIVSRVFVWYQSGTSPGIGGGGGGGSSFIYTWNCKDYLAIAGTNDLPGGMSHDVPQAIGVGEWDKKDGVCGQGGIGDKTKMSSGNGGAVRILAPGYF